MLKTGLIQYRTSPFSSSVLLVRKKDGLGDSAPIIGLSMRLPSKIASLSQPWMACSTSYMVPPFSLNWILQLGTTKSEYILLMCTRWPSELTVAIMNIWWCPLAYITPSPHFRLLWITCSDLRKFVLVFFDDILVYSTTWTLHFDHVRQVLEVLTQNQFFLKLKKCEFRLQKIEYLGYIVTSGEIKVDQKKIQTDSLASTNQHHRTQRLLGFNRVL